MNKVYKITKVGIRYICAKSQKTKANSYFSIKNKPKEINRKYCNTTYSKIMNLVSSINEPG